ncbi:MAG: protein kinase domain-containing protein [Fimbriiglobus sp.]
MTPDNPDTADAGATANFVVRLGLTDEITARECLIELENAKAPAADYVRLLERKSILTPLQSQKVLKGDRDGYFLGGFRILYRIASGSFGRVYRGDDPRSGQIVAVKVLRRRWTDDPRRVEHFEREGRIGRTIQHPNIVSILAVSKDQSTGQHFIVMDFVEGGNLRDILNIRKKIEPEEALRIMEECVNGLAYAHSRGLTHRDIKPSNILLSTDKTAKLVDFGLAEISASSNIFYDKGSATADKDEDAQMDRTIDYAGLEKATDVKQGDVRSDIYFLGHVLFEMIAGDAIMPRTKDKRAAMVPRRFEEVEKNIGQKAPEIGMHPSIVKLILKAVAFQPAARYQTPNQFLEAIRDVRAELSGEGQANRRVTGPLTIFVVEQNIKLQDVFRERLKKLGFRVLITSELGNALKRYQQSPYHAILIDAGSVGQEGVDAFRKILREADGMHLDISGALLLNEDQEAFVQQIKGFENAEAFVRPVGMKQLAQHFRMTIPELAEEAEDAGE